jgi:hypothetical protein
VKKFAIGYLALLALWWGVLAAPWAVVSGEATASLSGTDVSAGLAALPIVLLLLLFLIGYTRWRASLLIVASAVFGLGAWLASASPAGQPAVSSAIAAQTGIADATGQLAVATVTNTGWHLAALVVAILGSAFCLVFVAGAKNWRGRERRSEPRARDDEPDLWSETDQALN